MRLRTDEESAVWSRGERVWAALLTFGVLGLILVPVRQFRRPREARVDGFPMSYFPMFASRRDRTWGLAWAVGVHADGVRRNLPHHLLGPGGVNQVRKQMSRAVRGERAADHARLLAERVARHPKGADVVRVEVVRGQFDLDECLMSGVVEPSEVTVLAGADVPHGADAAAADAR